MGYKSIRVPSCITIQHGQLEGGEYLCSALYVCVLDVGKGILRLLACDFVEVAC